LIVYVLDIDKYQITTDADDSTNNLPIRSYIFG
jgi:hypothetical protein